MDSAVIVVGAGPAGLMLAGELRLAGVETIVVDRLCKPTGESRALGFTVRTMEVFDQRGLLPRLGEIQTSPMGHFGGLLIDFGVLDSVHHNAHGVPQTRTEAMLGEWATELGADIRRGSDVVGLTVDEYGVEVDIAGPAGPDRLRASYVVGCDGGHSTVRRLAGFTSVGSSASREMYLADVKGCDLRPRPFGERLPGGIVMAAPLGDGVDRIIMCERETTPRRHAAPATIDEVGGVWQRLTGQDLPHDAFLWASSFTDATRQATEYRRGRVLLAGDAAHTHLPAGGQGLNVSIQDSVNLGWKLGAVVHGCAPPGLLDSYHAERHPVGKRLLMNTRAQGLLFLTGDEMQPMRDVLTELLAFESVRRHLAQMVSGLEIRYDVGVGDHRMLGRRIPHQELVGKDGKTSTTELLHPARGVLLDLAGNAEYRRVASAWHGRVDVVSATAHEPPADSPLSTTDAVLIRPDGYVAWTAPDGGKLPAALYRWFGAPR
jgi:bifunctional hydroxylase/dehydrase